MSRSPVVSFDIFVQKFEHGEGVPADGEAIAAVLEPFIVRRDEQGWALLSFADGTADLYGMKHLGDGFMVNHVVGDDVWDVLVEVARAARMVVVAAGCPVALTGLETIGQLPDALREDAVVVGTGADLRRVVRAR
jgi:hypothetical protein